MMKTRIGNETAITTPPTLPQPGAADISEMDGISSQDRELFDPVPSISAPRYPNIDLPAHSHPHEQTGFMVSGKLRFKVEDEILEVEPGDSWCIPGGAEHSVDALEDSVVIEVFSPIREDYLPEP